MLAKFTFSTIGSCSTLRISPYLFYIETFTTQFNTAEKNDRSPRSFSRKWPFTCVKLRAVGMRNAILGNNLKMHKNQKWYEGDMGYQDWKLMRYGKPPPLNREYNKGQAVNKLTEGDLASLVWISRGELMKPALLQWSLNIVCRYFIAWFQNENWGEGGKRKEKKLRKVKGEIK